MIYTRQLGIVDSECLSALHVDLVGLGGIGSPTGMLLTKLGCRDMRVFDFDTVEEVNLCSQMYRLADARDGVPKARACRSIWRDMSGVEVEAVAEDATAHQLRGIVILAVDSMATRVALWERIRDRPQVEWLIDGRMGAESGTILTVQPVLSADRRLYESTLFPDEEALDLPCTGRAVIYNTFWIASLICRQVKRLVMDEPVESRIDFDLDGLMLVIQ